MRIALTSVFVDDQEKAEAFYTEVLGFQLRHKVPIGEDFWLTVVSPDDPEGTELLLEPSGHPAVKPFRDAIAADGIPAVQFAVDDIQSEYDRLRGLGVTFTQPPADAGDVLGAVFDDTCGNLIQLVGPKADGAAN
ncbi:VOC family protein [Mariniluteicoccus flavus]